MRISDWSSDVCSSDLLESDLGIARPAHGFLEHWAEQGVLLLNNVLTVEMGLAASHKDKGWEPFTDAVVAEVNRRHTPAVFMLWGSHAQKKRSEEHTSELQSLMRISYAVFCLKKKKTT